MSYPDQSPQTQPMAGWYPDPAVPGQERYWDGRAWTYHVRAIPQPMPVGPQTGYRPGPLYGPATADGVPLAGWWSRVAALLIDSLVVGVIAGIVTIPFTSNLVTGFEAWFDDAMRAANSGGVMPDYTDSSYGIMRPYWAIYLISLALQFCYSVSLQVLKGGTLGMLALGLRVVPLERGQEHRGLALGTSLLRNAAYAVLSAINIVVLVNYLAPLFNRRRQTFHDMIARTQVVRIR
ncbi:RDD family protein [Brooklawnia cerclae]|uniref:RDD family membrane protein YckC n=1 Tax=Brooklawnia cerclae TaxID=349934 RepID=A0ABX0SDP5_9ACTN|nr:putative RDD family membrane protein YckC [Brooklawnia cerclae]